MDVPNKHQTEGTCVLSIDKLLRIPQQHVHVRINALQRTLVLGLTPLKADNELGADAIESKLESNMQIEPRAVEQVGRQGHRRAKNAIDRVGGE